MENQAWVYVLRFQTIQTSSRLQQNQVTSPKQEDSQVQLEEGTGDKLAGMTDPIKMW